MLNGPLDCCWHINPDLFGLLTWLELRLRRPVSLTTVEKWHLRLQPMKKLFSIIITYQPMSEGHEWHIRLQSYMVAENCILKLLGLTFSHAHSALNISHALKQVVAASWVSWGLVFILTYQMLFVPIPGTVHRIYCSLDQIIWVCGKIEFW